jgi:hypothetical protein
MSTKGSLALCASVLVSLFSTWALAAALVFTPAEDTLDYGDVYVNQMMFKPVFTIVASGGDCGGTIRPDDDPAKPAPPGQQTIGPADFELASGDQAGIWIGIQPTNPGDQTFYIKIESTCGTYHKAIGFHAIGYGYVHGTVKDAASGQLLLSATVEPANPYLMQVTALGGGSYSARGYPGTHWLFANAPGHLEKMVNIELQEGDSLVYDFLLDPDRKSPATTLPWLPLLLE